MKHLTIKLILIVISSGLFSSLYSQKRSEKRGVSYEIPYVEDVTVLSKGVSWFYNWGVAPGNSNVSASYQDYLDYIPMVWNNGYDRTKLRNFLSTHPSVKYILGFNEPNFTAQANMGPAKAAAAWPELETIANEFGLKIVGPAVNYAPGGTGSVTENGVNYSDPVKYYDAFFAACPTCKVDYVAIHSYMNDPAALSWYVDQFVTKYKKPVWLTEFCAWENNKPLTSGRTEGTAYQKNAMVRKVEQLELNPMVAKYAWFIPRTNNEIGFPYMQLLRNVNTNPDYEIVGPGVLTELGKIYINMSSFDSAHYFGVNEQIPAKDYMQSFYVNLESSTDPESSIPIQIAGFEGGIFTDYFVDIPSAGQYQLSLRISSKANVNPKFTISSNETELTTQEVASTGGIDTWQVRSLPLTLPTGKQTIRISSNGISGCKFQWLNFSQPSDVKTPIDLTLKAFKDENNQLQIQSESKIFKVAILDLSGKVLLSKLNIRQIDISGLENGFYMLQVDFENNSRSTIKFVKN